MNKEYFLDCELTLEFEKHAKDTLRSILEEKFVSEKLLALATRISEKHIRKSTGERA